MPRFPAILLLILPLAAEEMPTARVGQPLRIDEIFIPGDQIEPVPRRDREPPLVVRILDVRAASGGFRYDFEVQGLDPGTYNLAEFLDASGNSEIPSIPLEITSALPGDAPPKPHALPPTELPRFGGYRTTLIALGALWLSGLLALLFWRRKKHLAVSENAPPPTLAERLKPLVAAASTGDLDAGSRARLDRLVIGHWRERLPEISSLPPSEALVRLRQHPEASPLLLALEKWLHAPNPERPANLDALLTPYRSSPS